MFSFVLWLNEYLVIPQFPVIKKITDKCKCSFYYMYSDQDDSDFCTLQKIVQCFMRHTIFYRVYPTINKVQLLSGMLLHICSEFCNFCQNNNNFVTCRTAASKLTRGQKIVKLKKKIYIALVECKQTFSPFLTFTQIFFSVLSDQNLVGHLVGRKMLYFFGERPFNFAF